MLTIDGSQGEGGGQVLRTALALSLITRTPFEIKNIRAGRARPGLQRQHLTCVEAAANVGDARIEDAALQSRRLTFAPRALRPGDYRFAVGTAGSAVLVLQTVLPALLTGSVGSTLTLEGGTHNPAAPPFEFLQAAFLPLVARMGPRIEASLDRCGFYPAGGGRFTVTIEPVARLQPLEMLKRGQLLHLRATALVSRLPRHIAQRERQVVSDVLGWAEEQLLIDECASSPGPGNALLLEIASNNLTEVFSAIGERGRPAERVAAEAIAEAQAYLSTSVPVGIHLADQLLLPLALAGSGAFRTLPLTPHSQTNIGVIGRFLDVPIAVAEIDAATVEVRVG